MDTAAPVGRVLWRRVPAAPRTPSHTPRSRDLSRTRRCGGPACACRAWPRWRAGPVPVPGVQWDLVRQALPRASALVRVPLPHPVNPGLDRYCAGGIGWPLVCHHGHRPDRPTGRVGTAQQPTATALGAGVRQAGSRQGPPRWLAHQPVTACATGRPHLTSGQHDRTTGQPGVRSRLHTVWTLRVFLTARGRPVGASVGRPLPRQGNTR